MTRGKIKGWKWLLLNDIVMHGPCVKSQEHPPQWLWLFYCWIFSCNISAKPHPSQPWAEVGRAHRPCQGTGSGTATKPDNLLTSSQECQVTLTLAETTPTHHLLTQHYRAEQEWAAAPWARTRRHKAASHLQHPMLRLSQTSSAWGHRFCTQLCPNLPSNLSLK